MSPSITTVDSRTATGSPALARLGPAVRRLFGAYLAWRTEKAAIAALQSMSDRALTDIGLTRAEITGAVRGGTARAHASAPEC